MSGRGRKRRTYMCVCVCVYIQRDQKGGLTSERRKEGDGRVRPVSHYYRAVRGDPSIRPWTTVHHTGTLLPIVERFSARGEQARRRGKKRRLASMLRRIVSSLRIYIYIQVLSQADLAGCNEWKRSGLLREEESRKFNFDHHGGGIYGRRWSQLG